MSTSHLTTELCRAGEHELAKEIAESVSVPKVIPIYMSSVFSFDDVPTLDSVYEGKKSGYVYSRMANPGLDAAQDVLRTLLGGSDGAIVFSAGMATITTIMSNVKAAIISYRPRSCMAVSAIILPMICRGGGANR